MCILHSPLQGLTLASFPQIAGKLHVEISRLGGEILDRFADINCDDSDDEEGESSSHGTPLIIRVSVCLKTALCNMYGANCHS